MELKTDYKDDIIASGTTRKYTMTNNSDGTVSLADATQYDQEGDEYGAKDVNETNVAVNRLNHVAEVTLTASGWSGSSAPYTQSVSVVGVTAEDEPILVSLLADGASETTQKAYAKAFACVTSGTGVTSDGTITFKVYKKPATDIKVGLKGV